MIGGYVGVDVGGRFPLGEIITSTIDSNIDGAATVTAVGRATVNADIDSGFAGSTTVTAVSAAIANVDASIAGSSTVTAVGSFTISLAREITDTETHIQKPVDYVLASDTGKPQGPNGLSQGDPSAMTRSMLNKIFGE